MATNEIGTVTWGSPNGRHSLYGSSLRLDSSGVAHFVNPLMPAGMTAQEWYSFLDFQSVRDTPSLPLLHHGYTYRIVPDIVSVPEDTFILEVLHFDRFDSLVDTAVLYPPEYEFEFPAKSHYYTIRLVNAGCDEIHFVSLTLLEVEKDG